MLPMQRNTTLTSKGVTQFMLKQRMSDRGTGTKIKFTINFIFQRITINEDFMEQEPKRYTSWHA